MFFLLVTSTDAADNRARVGKRPCRVLLDGMHTTDILTRAPFSLSLSLSLSLLAMFLVIAPRPLSKVMTKYLTAPVAFPGTPEWGMMLNTKEDLAKDAWLQ